MKFRFSGVLSAFLIGFLFVSGAQAGTVRDGSDLVPTGKGWGVEQSTSPSAAVQGNGISVSPFTVVTGNRINYHGGPIMPGTVNVYFIWYGNWTNGPRPSDSSTTVQLLENLFGTGGISGSGYELSTPPTVIVLPTSQEISRSSRSISIPVPWARNSPISRSRQLCLTPLAIAAYPTMRMASTSY
jgi:hypothetical protein